MLLFITVHLKNKKLIFAFIIVRLPVMSLFVTTNLVKNKQLYYHPFHSRVLSSRNRRRTLGTMKLDDPVPSYVSAPSLVFPIIFFYQ